MRIFFIMTCSTLDVKTRFRTYELTEMKVVMLGIAKYGQGSNDMNKCYNILLAKMTSNRVMLEIDAHVVYCHSLPKHSEPYIVGSGL